MSKRSSEKVEKPITSATSRARTRERRMEKQQHRRRQQQLVFLAVVVVVVVIAAALFIVSNAPADAPIPEGTLARYDGIPQDTTVGGFARLGNPDAPVRVEEFSSFACPNCLVFEEQALSGLIDLVVEGKISLTFIPMVTGDLTNPEGAHRAAYCAGQQGRFWEYHDMLFDWHSRYGNGAYSQNRLESGADELGLDTGEFNDCLSSSAANDFIDNGQSTAVERGVGGTPFVYVNNSPVTITSYSTALDTIRTQVDNALALSGAVPVPIDRNSSQSIPEVTPEVEEATALPSDESTPEATSEGS